MTGRDTARGPQVRRYSIRSNVCDWCPELATHIVQQPGRATPCPCCADHGTEPGDVRPGSTVFRLPILASDVEVFTSRVYRAGTVLVEVAS